MFVRIIIGDQTLKIPFSSAKIANAFLRGFNGQRRLRIQEKEYICRCENEQRGARFANIIARYCERFKVKQPNNDAEIRDYKEGEQSLFDGFD